MALEVEVAVGVGVAVAAIQATDEELGIPGQHRPHLEVVDHIVMVVVLIMLLVSLEAEEDSCMALESELEHDTIACWRGEADLASVGEAQSSQPVDRCLIDLRVGQGQAAVDQDAAQHVAVEGELDLARLIAVDCLTGP